MRATFFSSALLVLAGFSQAISAEPPVGGEPRAYSPDAGHVDFHNVSISRRSMVLASGETFSLNETSISLETDDPSAMGHLSAMQRFQVDPPVYAGGTQFEACPDGAKVLLVSTYDEDPSNIYLDFYEGFERPEDLGPAAQPCLELKLGRNGR